MVFARTARTATASLVAAAAAVAVGVSAGPVPNALPVSVRAFTPDELVGTFTRFISQGNCPVTIRHTGLSSVANGVINVPFQNIFMGGERCTAAGSMVVLGSTNRNLAGRLAEILQTNSVLSEVYTALTQAGSEFLVGFESVDRQCGASVFRAPTVTFFVDNDEGLSVPQVAFLRPSLGPYMMVFKTGNPEGIPCTYAVGTGPADTGSAASGNDNDDDDDDDTDTTLVPIVPVVIEPVNPADTADVDARDDDNDGLPDPSDPDDDNDGLNDNDDADDDGDGIADINDVPRNNGTDTDEGASIVPVFGGEDIDSPDDDNDGLRDPVDPDDDNDGRPDNADANNDGDDVPDVADTPRNDGMDDGEGAIVVPVTGDAGDTDAGNDDAIAVPVVDEGDDDSTDGDVAGVDDLEPSPSDDDSVCFPASAEVELDTGRTVRMDELAIGDNVRVSTDAFSRVFLFTHKLAAGSFDFVKLTTASAASLTVTRSHYVYANGKMTAAGAVKVGDKLELVGASKCDVVTAITSVTEAGLYNPQTLHGDIVVNGIRASTFTTAVEPTVASTLLAPLRALFRATGMSTSALNAGSARLAALLPSGASAY